MLALPKIGMPKLAKTYQILVRPHKPNWPYVSMHLAVWSAILISYPPGSIWVVQIYKAHPWI